MNARIDRWREKYTNAYEKRLTVVRNHIGVGYKRQEKWKRELAMLMLVRMCRHNWTVTDYKRYITIHCDYCKFSFLL